ncbi:hypothetical protein CNR22_22380 [Sphingobacteriaceae bacterium]|nr:hypothetical protein CNR22_22380 [Sphingobacteriaceae bacterium]
MKAVKDVMRQLPTSCGRNDSLQTVATRMSISKLEFLPVVDVNSEVIGTLIYKDIQIKMSQDNFSNLLVCDVMKVDALLVNTYDDEASALKLMRNNHASYLPVVDEKNHLKGVVSFVALARRIIQLKQELKRDSERMKVQGLGLSI